MKKLIFLILIAVIGYFAYQHFLGAPQQDDLTVEEETSTDSESISDEDLPPIPESCKKQAKNLENAIYGSASGQVSFAQRKTAYNKLTSCLREAGFSESQIDGTIAEIEERMKNYIKQDSG